MSSVPSSSSGNVQPPNDGRECVGPNAENAGKASACAGCPNQSSCASGETKTDSSMAFVKSRMASVKHIILVLSGKGGVGKSTFSSQLAFALAQQGKQVGLLDIDICGPSIPRMLGLVGHEVHQSASGWSPVYVEDNLAVMSIGFMLPSNDDAVIWRGPRKNGLIKQFLSDVVWGELDYLIIDTPPGTSDEHISIVQYLKSTTNVDGAVVVTTPQEVAMSDVRKELNFCKKTGIKVLGVVENMSDIKIPVANFLNPMGGLKLLNNQGENVTATMIEKIRSSCPELFDLYIESALFKLPEDTANATSTSTQNTPEGMAAKFNVPFLGKLPMDPNMMRACEEGRSFLEAFPHSTGSQAFAEIVRNILYNTHEVV